VKEIRVGNSESLPTTPLDRLDLALITELQRDGRASLIELGTKLGVSHGTVRNRLNRLLSHKIITISAVVDPVRVGYHVQAYVSINADLNHVESIESRLVRFEEVNFVATMTGRAEFLVGVSLASDAELREFLVRKLARVKGLRATETCHVLHLAKRPWQWQIPRR
jgi:Lrp/AsnC family transcriptional regulator for asnA, asnC and gidA